MGICSYYRGRLSFNEILNMPIDYIHTLEYLIWKHRNDNKDLKAAEAMEDELEELS